MSEPGQAGPLHPAEPEAGSPGDASPPHSAEPEAGEVVDGLPVVAPAPTGAGLEPVRSASVPGRQAAVLAATGFVAGAATAAILGRRAQGRALGRRRRPKGRLGEVVASNSFLVDVHVLRR